jgi:hypothetical protein
MSPPEISASFICARSRILQIRSPSSFRILSIISRPGATDFPKRALKHREDHPKTPGIFDADFSGERLAADAVRPGS